MDDKTKVLTKNGYEDGPEQGELRETELLEECKAFPDGCGSSKLTWHKITRGCSFMQRRSAGTWQSREPVAS